MLTPSSTTSHISSGTPVSKRIALVFSIISTSVHGSAVLTARTLMKPNSKCGGGDRAVAGSSWLPSDEATTGTNAGPEKPSTTEGCVCVAISRGSYFHRRMSYRRESLLLGMTSFSSSSIRQMGYCSGTDARWPASTGQEYFPRLNTAFLFLPTVLPVHLCAVLFNQNISKCTTLEKVGIQSPSSASTTITTWGHLTS